MGDAADSIMNGDVCQFCGEYIGHGQGFPRSCGCEDDGLDWLDDDDEEYGDCDDDLDSEY